MLDRVWSRFGRALRAGSLVACASFSVACAAAHEAPRSDGGAPFDSTLGVDGGVDGALDELVAALRAARCARAIHCEAFDAARPSCHPAATGENGRIRIDGVRRGCPGDVFNPDAASRCLAAAIADGCSVDRTAESRACGDVLGPAPPSGSTCRLWGCGPDAVCAPAVECEGPACPLHCVPAGRDGDPCPVWIEPAPDGQPRCAASFECREERALRTGVCRARTRPGDACDGERYLNACSSPQFCDEGTCVGYGVELGDDCNMPGFRGCQGDLHCMGTLEVATCQTGAPTGAACSAVRLCVADECDPPPCSAGNRCVGGTCVRIVGPGETCTATHECPFAFHCAASLCLPNGVVGEPCSTAAPCAAGVCEDGVCTGREPGAACESRLGDYADGLGECADGVCWRDIGTCPALIPIGGACSGAGDLTSVCEDGAVCDFRSATCAPARLPCPDT
jgi:hypothetical protein